MTPRFYGAAGASFALHGALAGAVLGFGSPSPETLPPAPQQPVQLELLYADGAAGLHGARALTSRARGIPGAPVPALPGPTAVASAEQRPRRSSERSEPLPVPAVAPALQPSGPPPESPMVERSAADLQPAAIPLPLPEGSGVGRRRGAGAVGEGTLAALIQARVQYTAGVFWNPTFAATHRPAEAVLSFEVDSEGYVSRESIDQLTGLPLIDRELTKVLHMAEPYPASGEPFRVTVRISFEPGKLAL